MTARRTLAYPKKGGTFYTDGPMRTNAEQKTSKNRSNFNQQSSLHASRQQHFSDLLDTGSLADHRLTQTF